VVNPARSDVPSSAQWRAWDIDPAWSRIVSVPSHDSSPESGGRPNEWHVLEHGPSVGPLGTVVCVHGNPTWSFYWRSVLRELGGRYRVIAPDQLGMGYSARTSPRRYAQRVQDLDDLLHALGVDGPITLVAHDWGGAIAMGWAVAHPDRVAGMVLTNTGIAVPTGTRGPALIRLAAATGVTDLACRRTGLFVRGTGWLSGRRLSATARRGLVAPYLQTENRAAIASFVADVPFSPNHPSWAALATVAAKLPSLDVPVLLAFGGRDPVFSDAFADDLAARFGHVERHRFAKAGHLVVEEVDIASLVDTWLTAQVAPVEVSVTDAPLGLPPGDFDGVGGRAVGGDGRSRVAAPVEINSVVSAVTVAADSVDAAGTVALARQGDALPSTPRTPLWAALEARASDDGLAFFNGATRTEVSWSALYKQVHAIAAGLVAVGMKPQDRVALLVPPGPELIAIVYGCWRAGLVPVIADRGLGLDGLGQAVRGTRPRWIVGVPEALLAARTLRWAPSARFVQVELATAVPDTSGRRETALSAGLRFSRADVVATLADVIAKGECLPAPTEPGLNDVAAILFTSGATGPAKGVRYRHGQLAAQRDALAATYGITSSDRLVAAFAPFALYGPALGITSAIPDVDVTTPGTLTADALTHACATIDATLVFASPAALANVIRTAKIVTVDAPAASGDPDASADLPLDVDATAGSRGRALERLRLVLSAGAPVPRETLRAMSKLCPAATLHTPYGMTECLPVADIDLVAIDQHASGRGVNVGHPVPGARVRIAALSAEPDRPGSSAIKPQPTVGTNRRGPVAQVGTTERVASPAPGETGRAEPSRAARADERCDPAQADNTHPAGEPALGEMGRVLVAAPWLSDGYDQLWQTEARARTVADGTMWHDSGDVGNIDTDGRLWIEGRAVHCIRSSGGVLTPVPLELAAQRVPGVGRAAVVGVGPLGIQQVVVIVEGDGGPLASEALTTAVRAALDVPVAAVLMITTLPVDIRHNAKIDRQALAAWATDVLAGHPQRRRRPWSRWLR
jgi:olefin beta-lactone synthetase